MTFDLTHPKAWDALGAAWRIAHAAHMEAIDEHDRAERAAEKLSAGAPGDAPNREEARARLEHNERAAALCGVVTADEHVRQTGDLDCDLIDQALSAPAPTLAAFLLKLEMLSDPGDWNALDDQTWPILAADARRFAIAGVATGSSRAMRAAGLNSSLANPTASEAQQ